MRSMLSVHGSCFDHTTCLTLSNKLPFIHHMQYMHTGTVTVWALKYSLVIFYMCFVSFFIHTWIDIPDTTFRWRGNKRRKVEGAWAGWSVLKRLFFIFLFTVALFYYNICILFLFPYSPHGDAVCECFRVSGLVLCRCCKRSWLWIGDTLVHALYSMLLRLLVQTPVCGIQVGTKLFNLKGQGYRGGQQYYIILIHTYYYLITVINKVL